jgi:hypothetical protein
MPVPKPRANEEKDDFISRCISSLHKTDPNRSDDQIIAMCYTSWRSKESIHQDFVKILNDFINIFGEEEGRLKYDEMIKAYNIDVSKAYRDQAQMKECWGTVCESYNWARPLIKYLKEDKDAKYYKVRALTATVSMNRNDYTNLTELESAARTIGYRPLNLNHDPLKELPFPSNRVVRGDFEDNSVECIIRIANEGYVPNTNYSLKDIQRMLDEGDIVNPSIEGEPEGGHRTPDGRKIPECYVFTALALLEKGVTLPGVPTTFGFEPLFLNESLGRSLVESLRLETHEKEEKTMSEPEHLPDVEESKTELVEGQGVQNIDVCGQCKFFQDLVNTTEIAPAVTGAPTSAEVTISSGAVGPGVGLCSVDGEYKQKQDPACTDGRPREQATNLDRVGGVESMNELTMKTQIAELEAELLRVTGERNKEIETNIKTATKLSEAENRLGRLKKDLALENENNTRLKNEKTELREKNDELKRDNTRFKIQVDGLEKDLELSNSRVTSLEEGVEKLETTLAEAQDEKRRALNKANEEIEKRVQAQQRSRNDEAERIRAVRESVELTERLSARTKELSESVQMRSAVAKREFALQKENEELRKRDAKLVEDIRGLKKDIEKLKKKDFDIQINI